MKHIYTTLVANQDIEISIDLPLQRLRALEESAESSLEDDNDEEIEGVSPRTPAAPQPDAKPSSAARTKVQDEVEATVNKGDGQGSADR